MESTGTESPTQAFRFDTWSLCHGQSALPSTLAVAYLTVHLRQAPPRKFSTRQSTSRCMLSISQCRTQHLSRHSMLPGLMHHNNASCISICTNLEAPTSMQRRSATVLHSSEQRSTAHTKQHCALQGEFQLSKFQDGVLPAAFMVGLLVASLVFSELCKHYNAFRLIGT